MKVKLRMEAEGPPKDDASGGSGPGDGSSRSGGADDSSATPDHGQEHGSDEDADGEADTQATTSSSGNNDTGSESDPFEDAEPGRKRALRGPPAGSEHRRHGGKHAGGDADASRSGVGRNKRIHRDESDMDEGPQDG